MRNIEDDKVGVQCDWHIKVLSQMFRFCHVLLSMVVLLVLYANII